MGRKVILKVDDWRGETVRLYAPQWRHIEEQHSEMVGQLRAIELVISDPDVVTESDTLPRDPSGYRLVTSRSNTHPDPRYSRLYVRVPIEYSQGGNWVTTAYVNPLPRKGTSSMSVSHPDSIRFRLVVEGEEQAVPLSSSYDEQADILYLWIGEKPREAISITSNEGHLVRLDPDDYEIVGVTVFDFCRRWQLDDPGGDLSLTLPSLGESEGEVTASQRLELVPA